MTVRNEKPLKKYILFSNMTRWRAEIKQPRPLKSKMGPGTIEQGWGEHDPFLDMMQSAASSRSRMETAWSEEGGEEWK